MKTPEIKVPFPRFLLNIFMKPYTNIQSNSFIPWKHNVLLICIIHPVLVAAGFVLRMLFLFNQPGAGGDEASGIELLIYLVLFFITIWLIPFVIINVIGIFIVNKYSNTPPSFQKLFSDHTNIFIQVFVLYYAACILLIAGNVTQNDLLFSILNVVIFIMVTVYFAGTFIMLRYYFNQNEKPLKIPLIYLIAMILFFPLYVFSTFGIFI